MTIADCLVECEIAESKAEAYRLLEQRAIKVDNQIVDKRFVFCSPTGTETKMTPIDVQSTECFELYDWYMTYSSGQFHDDQSFKVLGKLIDSVGVKRVDKRKMAETPSGAIVSMILGNVFLISRGKTDYWVVRLSDVSPEENGRLMDNSLDLIAQQLENMGL